MLFRVAIPVWSVCILLSGGCSDGYSSKTVPEPPFVEPDAGQPDATVPDAETPRDALRADRAWFDFGRVAVATQSDAVALTISNEGEGASAVLTASLVDDLMGSFVVVEDTCSGQILAKGDACLIRTTYQPKVAELHRATLTVGGLAVPLFGTGYRPSALKSSMPGLVFQDERVGRLSERGSTLIRNTGTMPTGALHVGLTGDTGDFQIKKDDCSGKALAALSECEIEVQFAPTVRGERKGSLDVSAQPGGVVALSLGGVGTQGARLEVPSVVAFGGADIGGAPVTRTLELENTGGEATGEISFSLEGSAAFSFDASACERGIDADGKCKVELTFLPTTRGALAATLVVAGDRRVALSGVAGEAVVLKVDRLGDGKGTVRTDSRNIDCGTRCAVTLRREGQDPVVRLSALADESSTFEGWSDDQCASAPNCTVTLAESKTISARFAIKKFSLRVRVRSLGGGTGTLASAPAGIACEGACDISSATYPIGARVRLLVTDHAGSNAHFSGDCSSASDVCDLTMQANQEVLVTLAGHNYAFVTSQQRDGALGGLSGADALCAQSAASAQLPGTFRAYLSTSRIHAKSRFTFARGFMLVDGEYVADTLQNGELVGNLNRDEFGVQTSSSQRVWSGSKNDGESYGGLNCDDWTATSSYGALGRANNKDGWLYDSDTRFCHNGCIDFKECDRRYPVYCAAVDLTGTSAP